MITCCQWKELLEEEDEEYVLSISLGVLVTVHGRIREFRDERQLTVENLRIFFSFILSMFWANISYVSQVTTYWMLSLKSLVVSMLFYEENVERIFCIVTHRMGFLHRKYTATTYLAGISKEVPRMNITANWLCNPWIANIFARHLEKYHHLIKSSLWTIIFYGSKSVFHNGFVPYMYSPTWYMNRIIDQCVQV